MQMIDAIAQVMVSPLNQFYFGILIGFAFIKLSKKRKILGAAIVFVSSLWLFLCSQYFFSHLLVSPLERAFKPIKLDSPQWENTQGIWVLACYHYDAEELPLVSQFNHCSLERLVHAASMYRIDPKPVFLAGADFVEKSELFHNIKAAALLQSLGVKEDDIKLVNEGSNTAQEALAVTEHIGQKRLAVVSSATHGKRLSYILDDLNVDYIFVPVHYSSKGNTTFGLNFPAVQSLARSERAMYEYAAIIKYHMIKAAQ